MDAKRKRLLLVVGSVIVFVALACTCTDTSGLPAGGDSGGSGGNTVATEEPASGNSFGIVVTDTHLYRDNGSGEPGEEVDFFSPGDRVMHFEVNTDGLPNGEITKWVFTAVETSDADNYEVASVETGEIKDADQLTANLTLPNDWPTGTYTAEVFVGDELIYTIEYEVRES